MFAAVDFGNQIHINYVFRWLTLLFDVMDCTPKNHRMSSKVSKRLTESTAPEVCEHIYTPRLNRDFSAGFPLLCDINQAHLLMLKTAGLISADDARQLANAMMQMEVDGPAKVPLDPLLEDAYFNFEAHLMRIAGAHVGGSLHMARSRNDILATMDRMRARELVLATLQALGQLQASALEGALRHAHVVMPGYTHLQPAQPVSYGYYLLAIAEAVERDSARMLALLPDLALCPLGAGALAGTSFPILRDVSAAALGFTGTVPTALDAVASRDYAMELLSSMARLNHQRRYREASCKSSNEESTAKENRARQVGSTHANTEAIGQGQSACDEAKNPRQEGDLCQDFFSREEGRKDRDLPGILSSGHGLRPRPQVPAQDEKQALARGPLEGSCKVAASD